MPAEAKRAADALFEALISDPPPMPVDSDEFGDFVEKALKDAYDAENELLKKLPETTCHDMDGTNNPDITPRPPSTSEGSSPPREKPTKKTLSSNLGKIISRVEPKDPRKNSWQDLPSNFQNPGSVGRSSFMPSLEEAVRATSSIIEGAGTFAMRFAPRVLQEGSL